MIMIALNYVNTPLQWEHNIMLLSLLDYISSDCLCYSMKRLQFGMAMTTENNTPMENIKQP